MAHYFNTPDPVDINAEFGCMPHTPPTNDTSWKATWSSPRRKRGWGWGWGSSKHDRSSSGLEADEYKENYRPPPPGRKRSIKNMFSSVRNGLLLYNQMPTEFDLKDCGPAPSTHQADTQPNPPFQRVVPEQSSHGKPLEPPELRRSKSLNFLGSLGQTLSARRGSKQRLGMLRVYPGMDQLSRNQEVWDEEGSSSKNNGPGCITTPECGESSDANDIYLRNVEPMELDANNEHDRARKQPGGAGRVHFEEPTKKYAPERNLTSKNNIGGDPGSFNSGSTIAQQPSQLDSTAEDNLVSRGNTPDSYLELLIESVCPPSDSDTYSLSSSDSPSFQDKIDSFVSMTPEEIKLHQRAEEQKKAANLLKSLEESGIPVLRPQYCPGGYQTINQQDHMDQLPIVSVREIFDSPHATVTSLNHQNLRSITHTEYEEREEVQEYEDQSDGLTTYERIKARIQRTLAIMTRNLYISDSEDDSIGDMEFSWTPKQKLKELSEVSEPTSVSASDTSGVITILPPRLSRPPVVKRGRKTRSTSSGSGRDSAIQWIEEITEEDEKDDKSIGSSSKQAKEKASCTIRPRSSSDSPLVPRMLEHLCPKNEENMKSPSFGPYGGIPEQRELLSGWGKSSFRNPSGSAFGPVQVNFPGTATAEGHTELYETRSEAITAIYHENHGEFDSLCTFDPTIRVIFVHPAGKFVPNFDEISKLGLEILSLPTDYNFDQAYLPYPLFAPQNKYSSVHEYKERISSVNELATMLSSTHPETGKGKAVENFGSQSTIHGGLDHPTDMVPPNSPNSTVGTRPGLAKLEQEGSVFEDDLFLEIDLMSQRFNSTCDLWQADSDQVDDLQQPNSASLNLHNSATETHSHIWEAKTWPELGREYITTFGSPSSHGSIYQNGIESTESQNDAEVEFKRSTNLNLSHHQRLRRVSSCEQFVIELQEAENRSLQQAIDEIVGMKGDSLDRGIALDPKKYSQVTVDEIEDKEHILEKNTTPVVTVQEQPDMSHVQEIIELFEDEEHILEKTTAPLMEVRPEESDMPHVQDIIDMFEDCAATNMPDKHEMRTFSYPLEYSPPPSRLDLDMNHSHHQALATFHKENQRHVSDASDQTNASGFRFTDYIQELAEIASNGSASTSHTSYEMGNRVLASVEPCRPPVNASGSPRAITAEDLNVRLVGKAAQESRLARREANGSALVGLFQSHGLMPQSQPTLRSSTTLGSSPFKNITNRVPSANSSPTATRGGNTDADVEKAAKATAFKRAFSELSVGSSNNNTDTLDFGEASQVLEQMRLLW